MMTLQRNYSQGSTESKGGGQKSCFCSMFIAATVVCILYFFLALLVALSLKAKSSGFIATTIPDSIPNRIWETFPAKIAETTSENFPETIPQRNPATIPQRDLSTIPQRNPATIPEWVTSTATDKCENRCRPRGTESLPEGIIKKFSNMEMRPLWGYPKKRPPSQNLLAIAVGIKLKHLVHPMVTKFLASDFVVMLFHYDGNVDDWKDCGWSDKVIHISAPNQTKWWFAKRFMHPDILVDYEYIFLWDEDLGIEHFDPRNYISIVKEEGLEISQPALDPVKSEMHHQITARGRRGNVHRRTLKPGECFDNSTAPPCTGWIEVMAPVISRTAWRCVWHLIQNDLIHAWGLDMHLGYCAMGDRTKNIGIVDAEYVVHHGLPTLGEPRSKTDPPPTRHNVDKRIEVRRQSYNEYKVFRRRWAAAIEKDSCWVDPYPEPIKPIADIKTGGGGGGGG